MTLDLRLLVKNVIEKQFKISHLDTVEVEVFNRDAVPEEVQTAIKGSYGEEYLLDSTYVAFFKTPGQFSKKLIGRLFKAVDSALGNDANRLADGDFKRLEMNGAPVETTDSSETDEETDDVDSSESSTNDIDIVDEPDDETTDDSTQDEEPFSSDDDDTEDDSDEEKSLDEDDENDSKTEDDSESSTSGPKTAVFLKITTK